MRTFYGKHSTKMCDRLKLVSEFYFNTKDNSVAGIMVNDDSDRLNLADEVLALVKDDKSKLAKNDADKPEEENHSTTHHVNQFRFRSLNDKTPTGEFFFDNGSLSGDGLTKQIKQVIFGFEMAGAKIAAVCLDGGGKM